MVTGAFGYTGRHIAWQLLARGETVGTLTGHPERPNPFGGRVRAVPFNFDRFDSLVANLSGVETLYNTYWVRFSRGNVTFDQAVTNTKTLIRAAEVAGVRRFAHVSITNPSADSPLPYFSGKAELETALRDSGLSHAIVRPTVVFGGADVLINNIAWLLRRFPVFLLPGKGDCRLQPVFVEDLAEIAIGAARRDENLIVDAVGPEVYTFRELVRRIAGAVGSRARIIAVPSTAALWASRLIGRGTGDVMLTRDEVRGLNASLLVSRGPPTGPTRLSEWLKQHANEVGRRYASELGRHFT
jgi:NADH dehydrogenase